MKETPRLTAEVLVKRMNEAGWSVQANGLVLCLLYGAVLTLNGDGRRAMLKLKSGWRTVMGTEGVDVMPPREVTVDGVRRCACKGAALQAVWVLADAAVLGLDRGEPERRPPSFSPLPGPLRTRRRPLPGHPVRTRARGRLTRGSCWRSPRILAAFVRFLLGE